jgi:hypothetical protein
MLCSEWVFPIVLEEMKRYFHQHMGAWDLCYERFKNGGNLLFPGPYNLNGLRRKRVLGITGSGMNS